MMRYVLLIAAIITAACTVPPIGQKPADVSNSAIPVSPTIEVTAPREEKRDQAPKTGHKVIPRSKAGTPDCSQISTGDDQQDLNDKLDCIETVLGTKP